MCFLGQVEGGVYVDDYENVHPSVLARYYGVHGAPTRRPAGQTGAGQLEDEDVPMPSFVNADSDDEDSDIEEGLEAQIEAAHAANFHHEPVPVPKHSEPFDDEDLMELFYNALDAANEGAMVPPGYGLLPQEWDDGIYPTFEILKSGRRGGKQLRVALPDSIWRPRAEMWGRALATLNQIRYMTEE